MTHLFPVDQTELDALKAKQRHLLVKEDAKIAAGDTVLVQCDREQVSFTISSVHHGPLSKYINSHYALLGLYAPYNAEDDVIDLGIGGHAK